MPYIGKGANGFGIRERYEYTATSGQTAFTGSDINSKTLSFDSGSLIDVMLNGVMLKNSTDWSASGSTVTLASGASTSDEVTIIVFEIFSLSDAMPKTGGTFSGGITGTTGTFSGDLTVDTSTLKVDSSNNRVGIGEASPAAPLHIETGTTTDIMRFGANGRWGFIRDNSDSRYVSFARGMNSSATRVLTVDGDNGKVGINTSSPDAKLDVEGTTDAEVRITRTTASVSGASTDQGSVLNLFNDIEFENGYDGNATVGQILFTSDDGSTGQGVRAKIACNKLGYSHSESLAFYVSPANTTTSQITAASNTNGKRMEITSAGKVQIGSTNTAGRLNVNFDHSGGEVGIELIPNATTATMINFKNAGGVGVGSITSSGSSTAFNTSSDYRLKENVNYSWDATSRLKQLKPARFNFKADADTTVDGFLAHEVSSIIPEAISGTKDETRDIGVIKDKDDVVLEENVLEAQTKKDEGQTWTKTKTEDVYQGIDQSKLVPLLVKTIQELEARIKALEDA